MASDVVARRLRAQHLVGPRPARAEDVVRWFGAVQAQDYRGALWAIGQRTEAATEASVEAAIAARAIVRTWPLRGTLHLVAADDVRWMLRWFTPRVVTRGAARYRQLGLDAAGFARAGRVLEAALQGGHQHTRPELYAILERAGIATTGERGLHVLGYLAMHGVLCLAAHRGKQPTFALLDEWIPTSRMLARDEALGELARRYLTSHGPATGDDFAWWAGIGLGEARRAIDLAGPVRAGPRPRASTSALLLPPYDEYTVAYRDRSAFLDPALAERTRNGIFAPVVVLDGRIAGTWKRTATAKQVVVGAELVAAPAATARRLLERTVARYGRFLGRAATLELRISRSRRRG